MEPIVLPLIDARSEAGSPSPRTLQGCRVIKQEHKGRKWDEHPLPEFGRPRHYGPHPVEGNRGRPAAGRTTRQDTFENGGGRVWYPGWRQDRVRSRGKGRDALQPEGGWHSQGYRFRAAPLPTRHGDALPQRALRLQPAFAQNRMGDSGP